MNITISTVTNSFNINTGKASDEVSTKKVDYFSIKSYLEELEVYPASINTIVKTLDESLDNNLFETKQMRASLKLKKGFKREISVKFFISY